MVRSRRRAARVPSLQSREFAIEVQAAPVLAVGRRFAVQDRDRAIGLLDEEPQLGPIPFPTDRAGERGAGDDGVAPGEQVADLAIRGNPRRDHVRVLQDVVREGPIARGAVILERDGLAVKRQVIELTGFPGLADLALDQRFVRTVHARRIPSNRQASSCPTARPSRYRRASELTRGG